MTWDAGKLALVTLKDEKDLDSLAAFEKQDWSFDLHQLCVTPKKKAH